jgi:toxin ParE1/3/4
MRLVFSPKAALDLEEIGDYIARDNPQRALSFVGELESHCQRITELPSAFPMREDLAPSLQMAVHGNYIILFRIQNNTVRIERIVHGARRLQNLL